VSLLAQAVDGARVVVVLGKGGDGRTTIAAALARSLARTGKRTLLFQAGAKDKLSRLFGAGPVGEQITELPGGLFAVNTNPAAALAEYGHMVLKFDTVYRLVMENPVVKRLLRAIPGVEDYSILGKLWFHTTETLPDGRPRWDTIVFDAPATGHSLSMFRIPRAILAAVPEGPLTRVSKDILEVYEDPHRTRAVLVTLPEELPATECTELYERLRPETGLTAVAKVINQVAHDRFFVPGAPQRVLAELLADGAEVDPTIGQLVVEARRQRARRQRQERYLARLTHTVPLPETRVPHLVTNAIGVDELGVISELLA
jgi:anion-transporting  ArsA/GET3 family ATPase